MNKRFTVSLSFCTWGHRLAVQKSDVAKSNEQEKKDLHSTERDNFYT